MIEMYCKLIIAKRRSFDKVPTEFKKDVEIRLSEQGYNTNGDLIISGVTL